MQKIVVISFLSLFLYNIFGQYLMLVFETFDIAVVAEKVPENTTETQDFVLKIPANLYLHAQDAEYENNATDFEVEGKFYQIVKQRIVNDTLEIYCSVDRKKEKIQSEMIELVKNQLSQEISEQTKAKSKYLFKNILKDFLSEKQLSGFSNSSELGLICAKKSKIYCAQNMLSYEAKSQIFSPPEIFRNEEKIKYSIFSN